MTTPRLIGFAGPSGSGKSTAAMMLVGGDGWDLVSLAAPLRQCVLALVPAWDEWHVTLGKDTPQYLERGGSLTPRECMRTLGDWLRMYYGNNALICAAVAAVERSHEQGRSVVIDDVRMPVEAAMVRALGGWMVHVQRPGCIYSHAHATEYGPGHEPGDLTLVNPGDLATLRAELISVLAATTPSPQV